ncbi:DUF6483 family protein [uncultured Robinsoniella sp.]|uniref:DUF6483 family protein n=1 Tax=uncultured Robinsoniella sp. TaxID=904190 RepID=UPI00374FB2F2
MYEQDYIMRMNRDVIRTLVKLVFNRDTELPIDITSSDLKSEEKRILQTLYGQVDLGNINDVEKELYQRISKKEDRALEKALLFYFYLNEQSNDFLLANNYSREKIRSGLKFISSQLGMSDIIDLNYIE